MIHSIIEEEKSSYFAEFIGFTVNNTSDPYFGNILIKFYPIGDLMQFTRKLSNPKKFKKDKKDRLDEIILLVDLAKQIAEGKFIMNYLSPSGMNYLYQIPNEYILLIKHSMVLFYLLKITLLSRFHSVTIRLPHRS